MVAADFGKAAEAVRKIGEALRLAHARHECALGRLRHELPKPSAATLQELEAAETELRLIQSRHDALLSGRASIGRTAP